MSTFDWSTDDDGQPPDQEPEPVRRARRAWPRIAFLILLLAMAAGWSYRQLRQWSADRVEAVEQDVLAAFELWRRAAAGDDAELLEVLLEGAAPGWSETQRRLLQSGQLLDRPQLGLAAVPDQAVIRATPAVDLDPGLRRATVTYELAYRPQEAPAVGPEDVPTSLQHTLLLRRQGGRWVLAEPDAEFWGEWQTETFGLLSLTYRQRDADLARRLGSDLAIELSAACDGQADTDCSDEQALHLRLESDPQLTPQLVHRDTPFFDGETLVLPAPGLLGRPTDGGGYERLYAVYADRLRPVLSGGPSAPLLPEQDIQILCFAEDGYAPGLYRYDPRLDHWLAELPQRAFRNMWSLPGDEGLILRDYGSGLNTRRLQLTYWHQGQALPFADEPFTRLFPYLFDWNGQTAGTNVIFQRLYPNLRAVRTDERALARLDLAQCDGGDCSLQDLDGFPVWSPDGTQTLLARDNRLWLGDGQGRQVAALGDGFSPFWLDNRRYGFARYLLEDGALQVEVVLASVGQETPRRLLTSTELMSFLADAGGGQLFINYVAPQPGGGRHLLLAANRYATEGDHFFLLAAELHDPLAGDDGLPTLAALTLRLQLALSPSGYPSLVTPDGSIPFTFSPDGRWLSLSQIADKPSNHWYFYLHDIEANETRLLTSNHPVYTAKRPYMDWSADGQWLLIVDDGFLQLAAPAHDYRRLVSHPMKSCLEAAWVNPLP